jgi:hypothetical protein
MKRKLINVIPFLVCCSIATVFSSLSSQGQPSSKSKVIIKSPVKSKVIDTSLTDFLTPSPKCVVRRSAGGLQGTNHSPDSTFYLCFADFYNCKETYTIIFLYKDFATRNTLGNDPIDKIFFDSEIGKDTFNDFQCYAFVYPKIDPEIQDDIHKSTIGYPVIVRSYKRVGRTTWKFIAKKTAKNFHEFSEFEFRTIYGLK